MWEKIGLILNPKDYSWIKTGTIVCTPYLLEDGIVRLFFGGRDEQGMSRIGYVDVDFENNFNVINSSENFIIDIGELGCFDDCGITPGSIIEKDNELYFYYAGMTLNVKTDLTNSIGLLKSDNKQNPTSFQRYSRAPIFGKSDENPFHVSTPYVLLHNGKYKMWHMSGTEWKQREGNSRPLHYYLIKYAESTDGINWVPFNARCIDYQDNEFAIVRPTVLIDDDLYKMWYTYRGGNRTYRIGYAESNNGIDWVRKDSQVGIGVSEEGWDSEMICYSYVFDYKDMRYMLYNGNGYGKTGIGLARLKR